MCRVRQLCIGILVGLATHQPAIADQSSDQRWDADSFNALTNEQRVGYVQSVLDARDRKLSNFKYALRESCTNVNVGSGARRFMVRCEYEVRRIGDRLWMHLTNHKFGNDTEEIDSEGTVAWDGKLAVNLVAPNTARKTHYTASVRDKPNNNLWSKMFNELLGLRVVVEDNGIPITEFLRGARTRGDPIIVQADRRRPDVMEVKVDVRRGDYDRWTFWLDPHHDHMISRFEYRYEENGRYMAHHEEVVVPFQVSGVWVPKEAVHLAETSTSQERSEYTYSVTKFEIGSVTPAEVEIRFPVGTEVADLVNQAAYTVLPDGRRQMEPLAQLGKQTLRVPPKNAVTALPVAEAAKLYTSEPLVIVKPPPKVSPTLRIFVIALNAIVVVAAVGFYYLRRKKRLAAPIADA